MNFKQILKIGVWVVIGIVVIVLLVGGTSMWEKVKNTEYVMHESAFSGELTSWNTPGWKKQMFGGLTKYNKTYPIYLSSDKLDGGEGANVQAVKVLFPDGNAGVDIAGRFRLPTSKKLQKKLHIDYSGDPGAVVSMVRQQLLEAAKAAGPLMSSAEAYSHRRADFIKFILAQAHDGIYKANKTITTSKDNNGNDIETITYDVERDSQHNPIITKPSILKTYGIVIYEFNVKDMDFDDKTEALINARKEAQKAKQDAITAKQKGEALIATEKATYEVEKMREITIAQKEKEVAVLNAQRERDVAKLNADKAKQEALGTVRAATAKKQELALADGLSERAKYEIDKRTEATIESAKYYSKWVGPQIVVNGTGGKGGSGLGDVLMLERYQSMLANGINGQTK